jgi:hypothetical protein
MNGPIIQTDVEERLMILTDRLDKEVEYYATVSTERAINEATYKKLYATTLLQSEGTVATREALAQVHSAEAFHAWKIAEAKEKATQQSLIAIRNQMDALRTICANVRSLGG